MQVFKKKEVSKEVNKEVKVEKEKQYKEKKQVTMEDLQKYIAYLLDENKEMKQRVEKIASRLGV